MPQFIKLFASEQTNSKVAKSSESGRSKFCWHPYISLNFSVINLVSHHPKHLAAAEANFKNAIARLESEQFNTQLIDSSIELIKQTPR